MSQPDSVNPGHYAAHKVAPIDLIDAYSLTDGFCRGNVIKYVARAGEKNGNEDDRKALWYLLHLLGFSRERIQEITKEAQEINDYPQV